MSVKERIGTVISDKMNKTIVVKVVNRHPHSIYSKIIIKTKKYLAHDEKQISRVGDLVLIKECRPLSKKKHWKLNKILIKSSLM